MHQIEAYFYSCGERSGLDPFPHLPVVPESLPVGLSVENHKEPAPVVTQDAGASLVRGVLVLRRLTFMNIVRDGFLYYHVDSGRCRILGAVEPSSSSAPA